MRRWYWRVEVKSAVETRLEKTIEKTIEWRGRRTAGRKAQMTVEK